ncbi:MAG: hypothetical protein RIE86_09185 [Imperialibacter sp.]|uniref:hypothetical protein n=1 Tax=Imperialibacter sp. TaxID=2038411 RepID=UPI0032EAD907
MARFEKLLKDYDEHAKQVYKSTEVDVTETPEEKVKRIAHLEADYARWFCYYFPHYVKAPCAWFHIRLAKLIINNPILYLIVNWYRGSAKTVHVCMGIPLYLMIRGELKFMLLVGQTEKKAKRLLSDIQVQLKYNQKFCSDYGEQFQQGDWADGEFSTRQGIRFMCIGLEQSPRGARDGAERPDYIACSDVDTKERCKNPMRVREAVEWIMEDLWGCFDSAEGGRERFILDNNRIAKTSIVNVLNEEFKTAILKYKEQKWKVIHHYFRVIAHDENFKPAWPERTSADYWKKKRASRPAISYNREYLDAPTIVGKVFKERDILWKPMLPINHYDALALAGDLSYKDGGDFKAMRLWGKKGREKHLIAAFVRQTSRREAAKWTYDLFEDLNNKNNHLNIKVKIDGLFAQDEFVNDFDLEGDERGWHIPVIADKRPPGNKYDRIESTVGQYQRHWIYWNIKKQHDPDFQEGKEQLLAFEKGSGFPDDAPDADHAALDMLDRQSFVEKFQTRIKDRPSKTEDRNW